MKSVLILVSLCLLVLPAPLTAADLEVSFVDPAWNGEEVPEGEQCQKFGGQGRSPELRVRNIPAQADLLTLDFDDQSYAAMDNGGHGRIGYQIEPGVLEVVIPRVDGHTMELPENFLVIEAHRAPTWDKAGAYLPPCSGGSGNAYHITVRAVHQMGGEQHVLAETGIAMGKY